MLTRAEQIRIFVFIREAHFVFSRNCSSMNRCNFVFRKLITNAEYLDEYEYVNESRVAGDLCRTENIGCFI